MSAAARSMTPPRSRRGRGREDQLHRPGSAGGSATRDGIGCGAGLEREPREPDGRSGPERRDRGPVPPHRAEAIRTALREEARVEATGAWQERRLHTITDAASGASVEAHEPPTSSRGKAPGPHRPLRRGPCPARRGGPVALAAPDDARFGRTTGLPGVRAGSYNTSFWMISRRAARWRGRRRALASGPGR
jgi:hypothetical protein